MGRVDGPTRGRDGNVHLADDRLGLISMVSHLPAMLPVAVGCALAFRIRDEKRVAVGWFGEGASARGDTHEGMNFAGVRSSRSSSSATTTSGRTRHRTHLEYACEHVADRAQAYGFDGVVVDGTDVLAVYREAKRAIEKARDGGGPTLIECLTLRMEGHAVHDDAFYVPREMLEEWAKRDPLERFRTLAPRQRGLHGRGGGRDPRAREEAPERRDPESRGEPAARAGRRSRRRLRHSRRARHSAPQVETDGRQDVPPGDLGRASRRDAPRQAGLRDRRGHRASTEARSR